MFGGHHSTYSTRFAVRLTACVCAHPPTPQTRGLLLSSQGTIGKSVTSWPRFSHLQHGAGSASPAGWRRGRNDSHREALRGAWDAASLGRDTRGLQCTSTNPRHTPLCPVKTPLILGCAPMCLNEGRANHCTSRGAGASLRASGPAWWRVCCGLNCVPRKYTSMS